MLRVESPSSDPATPLQKSQYTTASACAEASHKDGRFQGRASPSQVVGAGHPPTPTQVLHLQCKMGNLAVGRILAGQRIGAHDSGTASRGRSMTASAVSLVLQRRFDVLFHIRAPNSQPENRNWRIAAVLASGESTAPSPETMGQINKRQPAYRRPSLRDNVHLRHVIPWSQIKQDVVDLMHQGRGTLGAVARHINAHWPEEPGYENPGIVNVNTDSREAVEEYARTWALARSASPRNLFWGGARDNLVTGSQYDDPTTAMGPSDRSAFNKVARTNVVREQLESLVGRNRRNLTQNNKNTILDWLRTESELPPEVRQHANNLNTVNEVVDWLIITRNFRRLTLYDVYNRPSTPNHPYGY